MTKNKFKETIIMTLSVFSVALMCGLCIVSTIRNDNYDTDARNKQRTCNTYLHNAGKSLTASDAAANLGLGISCFNKIRDVCLDNLDDEINILIKLRDEAAITSVSNQEVILQKINRIIFEGGTACHKWKCSYNETVFICKNLKSRYPR